MFGFDYNSTVKELLEQLKTIFADVGIENAQNDAQLLVAHVLNVPKLQLVCDYSRIPEKPVVDQLAELASRRCRREPLQYIIGEVEFMGLKMFVDKNVLIPRFETELLAEIILTDHKAKRGPFKVLDLCTGSGAIAVALAKSRPDWSVEASDISPEALKVAKSNAEANIVEIVFHKSDMLTNIEGRYDLIVSNPPYISPEDYPDLSEEIRCHEPQIALLAEGGGLFYYRELLENVDKCLKENGLLYLEIGAFQRSKIEEVAVKNDLQVARVVRDYNDFERIMIINKTAHKLI